MATRHKRKRLLDAYRFSGFRPQEIVKGLFGDHTVRVVTLVRRSKNRLWCLWPDLHRMVRPQDPSDARSALRRYPDLSRDRGPARGLPALLGSLDQGCGEGTAPRLANSQGAGQAVLGCAAEACRHAGAEGHRNRRDLGGQRTRLSHRGERPDPPACDLVRRRGPIRSQHGALIRGHWREKEPRRPGSP